MPDPTTPLSIDSLQTYMTQNYPLSNPRWSGLWNVSQDNTLAADFLIQTPAKMWGIAKADFKVGVAGNYPGFNLQECSDVTDFGASGTKLCQIVRSTVTKVGGTPAKLYVSPGFGFYERVYDAMINAKYLIDITTLFRPSGQFKAAIKNAITYIASKPADQRPKIRILHSTMGFPSTASAGADRHDAQKWEILSGLNPLTKVDTILNDLTADVPAGSNLEIYLAVVSTGITGWNHSKIVAVDGCRAIAGGQNLWDDHYLGPHPVFDLSMELSGTAALHTQQYVDLLWLWTPWGTAPPSPGPSTQVPRRFPLRARNAVSFKNGTITEGDLPPDGFYGTVSASFPSPATSGTSKVMTIGRQAQMRWPELSIPSPTGVLHALVYRVSPDPEPADDAILQLFGLAKTSINLCLQNIQGGYLYYLSLRRPYMEELARAILRGVQVKMVVSSSNGSGGYDGDDVVAVNLWMRDLVAYENGAVWPLPLTDQQKNDAAAYVTRNFQCANIRFSNDATYPDGTSPLNHSKTFIVDDQVFYVGSHNLYPSNLNEFGFIVDDSSAAAIYLRDYWNQVWQYSKVTFSSAFSKDGLDDVNKADAVCFLADLVHNKRLNFHYNNLIDFRTRYAPASGAPSEADYKATTAVFITNLLRDAGYETTAAWVQAALGRPPFAPPQGLTAGDQAPAAAAAQKCVQDLTTRQPLLASFDAVVFATYPDNTAAGAAINQWLTKNGYACTVSDLNTAISNAADQALQMWTGFYDGYGFELADGGVYFTQCPAFDLGAPNDPAYQPDWVPDYPAPTDPLPLTIATSTTDPSSPIPYVAYGKIEIQNPSFVNGVLTWSKGDGPFGNQTAAALTFSRIMRPAMLDSFQGREVYGWIERSDGTRVSYYNRESKGPTPPPDTPPAKPRDTTASSNYTGIILGAIGGAVALGLLALCVGKFRSARAEERYRRLKQDDDYGRDSDGNVDWDGASAPPTAADTSNQLIEMSTRSGTITPEQASQLRTQSADEVAEYQDAQAKARRDTDDDMRSDDVVDEDADW